MRQILFSLLLPLLVLPGCGGSSTSGELPRLMVERLGWMDQVARAKQARSLPVDDPGREAELLAEMSRQGTAAGLPEAATRAFFTGQMEAAKALQREWLAAHPDTGGEGKPVPDLSKVVRPALDRISSAMVRELVLARARHEDAAVVARAEKELSQGGFSSPVTKLALEGLRAGLR